MSSFNFQDDYHTHLLSLPLTPSSSGPLFSPSCCELFSLQPHCRHPSFRSLSGLVSMSLGFLSPWQPSRTALGATRRCPGAEVGMAGPHWLDVTGGGRTPRLMGSGVATSRQDVERSPCCCVLFMGLSSNQLFLCYLTNAERGRN